MATKRKQSAQTRKTKKRPQRVLAQTENGLEWQTVADGQEKKPADEIFERVLSKFGWSTSPEGSLEHVGSDRSKEIR